MNELDVLIGDRTSIFCSRQHQTATRTHQRLHLSSVWDREATEEFYRDEQGWVQERLFETDLAVIEWRRLASKHASGVQRTEGL